MKSENFSPWDLACTAGIVTGTSMTLFGKPTWMKVTGAVITLLSAGKMAVSTYRSEKERISEAYETAESEVKKRTGLDIRRIETVRFDSSENGEIAISGTLLQEIYNNSVFPNEVLDYNVNNYLGTLHILQNVKKKRLIVSIPLPRKTKKGICPQDVREYFSKIYKNFIARHELSMDLFLNQTCYQVCCDPEDNTPYFLEIDREKDETFKEYLGRITNIIEAWESNNPSFVEKYSEIGVTDENGEEFKLKTVRFDHYLTLEFPVYPETSDRNGVNVLNSVELIKELMETHQIPVKSTGREETFVFDHIAFHPDDEYHNIYTFDEDGKLVVVSL